MQRRLNLSSGTPSISDLQTLSSIYGCLRFRRLHREFNRLPREWDYQLRFIWQSERALVRTLLFRGSHCRRCRLF